MALNSKLYGSAKQGNIAPADMTLTKIYLFIITNSESNCLGIVDDVMVRKTSSFGISGSTLKCEKSKNTGYLNKKRQKSWSGIKVKEVLPKNDSKRSKEASDIKIFSEVREITGNPVKFLKQKLHFITVIKSYYYNFYQK